MCPLYISAKGQYAVNCWWDVCWTCLHAYWWVWSVSLFFFFLSFTSTYHLYLSLCSRSLCLPLSSTFPCTYVIHSSVIVYASILMRRLAFFARIDGTLFVFRLHFVAFLFIIFFFTTLSFFYCFWSAWTSFFFFFFRDLLFFFISYQTIAQCRRWNVKERNKFFLVLLFKLSEKRNVTRFSRSRSDKHGAGDFIPRPTLKVVK